MGILPDYGDAQDPAVRARYGRLAAVVGLGGNAVVFVGKLALGLMVASMAILGDSLNHLVDLAVSAVMLYSFYLAAKPADEHHPYGHGRAEPILAVVVSTLVISMGVLVIREALANLSDPGIDADMTAVYLMLAFTLVKVFLAAFSFAVARKIRSEAVRADGWNHLSDTLISLTVAGGVALIVAYPEYRLLDPVLALGIGVFVVAIGIKLVRDSATSLMGTAPDRETLEGLVKCAKAVPGVLDAHGIEIHEYGAFKSVSMHIKVSESMGAGDAHRIAQQVEDSVGKEFRTRPIVHIDPVKRHCEECELALIKDIAKGFKGVISVHEASMHHTPNGTVVDMHVLIDGSASVEEGHNLVHDIMGEVARRLPDHRVDIHLEPCKGNCEACKEECEKRGS